MTNLRDRGNLIQWIAVSSLADLINVVADRKVGGIGAERGGSAI